MSTSRKGGTNCEPYFINHVDEGGNNFWELLCKVFQQIGGYNCFSKARVMGIDRYLFNILKVENK